MPRVCWGMPVPNRNGTIAGKIFIGWNTSCSSCGGLAWAFNALFVIVLCYQKTANTTVDRRAAVAVIAMLQRPLCFGKLLDRTLPLIGAAAAGAAIPAAGALDEVAEDNVMVDDGGCAVVSDIVVSDTAVLAGVGNGADVVAEFGIAVDVVSFVKGR
jgi:hypothetical protein